MAQLFIAVQGTSYERHGRNVSVTPGDIAEEGSYPVENSPGIFRPLVVRFPKPGGELEEQKPPQQHPPAPKKADDADKPKADEKPAHKPAHKPAPKAK